MPQSFRGLNHLKLASVDLGATATFYTTIFPFTYLPHYDHHRADGSVFAVMFRHEASGILVEARQNPAQAAAQVGWDPVTRGVDHSRVLRGVKGWVLCARDPDGKIVRLYTEEEHEWALPEEDEVWLGFLEDK
ncbi:40S ribosomal S3 protein0 [Apiospora saccharicola]|uniref:40S ribosomal S3 protein0 n=1 Tax=Apiospora saccharicola TaxID=335842 RepID=A0ABR1VA36_9PEZI